MAGVARASYLGALPGARVAMPRRAPAKPRREAPDPPPREQPSVRLVPVERGVRLSASRLWDLQRAFFVRQDPRAWGRGRVPSYVTTNAFVARAAARVVRAFAQDVAEGRLGPAVPGGRVDVLELGAGSGRFAYGVLRELEATVGAGGAAAAGSSGAPVGVRYVITDFDAAPVQALREEPLFRPFVERGLLDFAVVDVEAPGEVRLLESGDVLRQSEGAGAAPVVAIATYVFDGVRTDAFEVRDGVLREALARLDAPEDADPRDPDVLPALRLSFEAGPEASAPYGDEGLDRALRACAAGLPDGSLLFPVAALRFLRHLRALGGGRALLLAADRGHVHADALRGLDAPHLARHGSVSLDVNFVALAEDARASGGHVVLPPHHPTHLAAVGLLWGAREPEACRATVACREGWASGLPEDLFLLKEALDRQGRRLTLERALAWLRVAAWDAEVFLACAPLLIEQAATLPPVLRADVADAARRVRAAYFPVGGDRDVPMALGELMQELEEWEDAAALFDESLARHGRHPGALHRRALAASVLGRTGDARALVAEALALDPRHADARALRDALDDE